MNKNEKYFLNSLRFAPCHAALSFRYAPLGSFNKGYTRNGSARHFSKFCSVSLRKTSYIPDVKSTLRFKTESALTSYLSKYLTRENYRKSNENDDGVCDFIAIVLSCQSHKRTTQQYTKVTNPKLKNIKSPL